jgi:hypothetical protein
MGIWSSMTAARKLNWKSDAAIIYWFWSRDGSRVRLPPWGEERAGGERGWGERRWG